MATAEEMLAQTLNESPVLTVDWSTRMIDIPSTVTCLGVESDDDVTRINFKMPQYYDEVDLSEFRININYLNANAEGDMYSVSNFEFADEFITFTWIVGRHALMYKGNVRFNVCLKKFDENDSSIVIKELNTTIATLPVLEGLETSEAVIQQYADILAQWEQRLFGIGTSFEQKLIDITTEQKEVIEQASQEQKGVLTQHAELIKSNMDAYAKTAVDDYLANTNIDVVITESEIDLLSAALI